MMARVVGLVVVLVAGGLLLPTLAGEDPPKTGGERHEGGEARDRRPAPRDDEALLDELDEVRVREEILTIRRDAQRMQLGQAVQTMGLMGTPGSPFFGGIGGGVSSDESREQQRAKMIQAAKQGLEEAQDHYLETTRELRRVSRHKAELEARAGVSAREAQPAARRPAGPPSPSRFQVSSWAYPGSDVRPGSFGAYAIDSESGQVWLIQKNDPPKSLGRLR